jgi:hypothetical protein
MGRWPLRKVVLNLATFETHPWIMILGKNLFGLYRGMAGRSGFQAAEKPKSLKGHDFSRAVNG